MQEKCESELENKQCSTPPEELQKFAGKSLARGVWEDLALPRASPEENLGESGESENHRGTVWAAVGQGVKRAVERSEYSSSYTL